MAFKFSTGLRKKLCFNGSLKTILDDTVLRLYSGPVPQDADAPLTGNNVMLCEVTAGGDGVTFEGDSADPTLTKSMSEVWQGDVLEAGYATFFRLVKEADTGNASSSSTRIQGTVGGPAADLMISNPQLAPGAPQRVEYFAIALLEHA